MRYTKEKNTEREDRGQNGYSDSDLPAGEYKKEPYSWIAVALVIISEILMLFLPQTHYTVLLALSLFLLLLWGICKMMRLSFSYRSTISKLLANAISPTSLGTVYLLIFVIHIGWLGNAVHGLFSQTGTDFVNVLFSTLVCIVGLLALVLFFPRGKEEKASALAGTTALLCSSAGVGYILLWMCIPSES